MAHPVYNIHLFTSNVTSVTEVRSASGRLFAGTWRPVVLLPHSIMLRLFFIIECGIARFPYAMRVFEVRASSSSSRLPLCLFLLQPPLLSYSPWRKIIDAPEPKRLRFPKWVKVAHITEKNKQADRQRRQLSNHLRLLQDHSGVTSHLQPSKRTFSVIVYSLVCQDYVFVGRKTAKSAGSDVCWWWPVVSLCQWLKWSARIRGLPSISLAVPSPLFPFLFHVEG